MVYHLKRQGRFRVGRKRVRRLMENGPGGSSISKAARILHVEPNSPGESSVSVSSSRTWRSPGPIRCGCTAVTYIPMRQVGFLYLVVDHGLVSRWVALSWRLSRHAGAVLLLRSTRGSAETGIQIPRRSSIQSRGVSSPATENTGLLKGAGVRSLDGRERPLDGQRSSSSVCGVHSNTNASI